MDFEEIFNKAFKNITVKYPCSDHETAFRNVTERAEKMKNKVNKTSRALYIIGGFAAGAAVICAGAFGLKFLAENGGLKGPDVSGGAGYHEDVTGPAETTAEAVNKEVTETTAEETETVTEPGGDILEAVGDVLEFSDMTITIESVEFDGQFIRAEFSEEYHGDPGTQPDHRIWLNKNDITSTNEFPYVYDIEDDTDPHIHRTGRYILIEPGQTVKLSFGYSSGIGDDPVEYLGNYTLTGINTDGLFYVVKDDSKDTSVTVSQFGAIIQCPLDYAKEDSFSVSVRYRDGSETKLAERDTYPRAELPEGILYRDFYWFYSDFGIGTTCLISLDARPINVANISGVIINGEQIGTDPDAERETSIGISFNKWVINDIFEFSYYIDGELQEDMTETRDMSEEHNIVWNVKGKGVHNYAIYIKNTENGAVGKMLDMIIDFSKDPPEKQINNGTMNARVFREIMNMSEDENVPEPIISAG
jgi:hypothetical protein